ncbi:MAG: hypothetical protein ABFC98_04380 [Candidatus Cloacimonas sp.]
MAKFPIYIILLILPSCLLLAQQVTPLPVTSYDYALPENNVSPFAMGSGGLNLTNADDPFCAYGNPALMADNTVGALSVSFRLKNQEDLDFYEALQFSNTLKDKQFKYFVLNTGPVSFSYQPVSAVHISQFSNDGMNSEYYDYQLDKVQFSWGGRDERYPKFGAGLNVKYLTGRLVYLKEHKVGNNLIRDGFIDDKVRGASGDLGFTYKIGNVIYAASFYDLLSMLWWENYDGESIQRRAALGVGFEGENSHYYIGMQGKMAKEPESTIHFGYDYSWNFSQSTSATTTKNRNSLDLRFGVYSHDFYGTDNINYTLGGGYYYKNLRFDFSLTNSGMKLADSDYLFSISAGI